MSDFSSVSGHESVKESIELARSQIALFVLRSQDPTKSLSFLSPWSCMERNLNDDVCSRQIKWSVSHTRDYYCIDLVRLLEKLEDAHSFLMGNVTRDVGNYQLLGILFNAKNSVTEDDDLVSSLFVQFDKVFARDKFCWIHAAEDVFLWSKVLAWLVVFIVVEVSHLAPDFYALNAG